MAAPGADAFKLHREKLTDTLNNCIDAGLKLPKLIQGGIADDLAAQSKLLVGREPKVAQTSASLQQLPTALASYDEAVQSAATVSEDILRGAQALNEFLQARRRQDGAGGGAAR